MVRDRARRATIKKTFDQVSKGVDYVYFRGAFPVVLGGDHSLGFATVRGIAQHLNGKKLGIIHFDRHVENDRTSRRIRAVSWSMATFQI